MEVLKAKAAFLKTALGCDEREPVRLRATVNNADALHSSSSCHIQNEGGEWGGFAEVANEREIQTDRHKSLTMQGYTGSKVLHQSDLMSV